MIQSALPLRCGQVYSFQLFANAPTAAAAGATNLRAIRLRLEGSKAGWPVESAAVEEVATGRKLVSRRTIEPAVGQVGPRPPVGLFLGAAALIREMVLTS